MTERKSAVELLPYSLINGEPGNKLAIDDRGLLYGDGLFETIAYRHSKLELFSLHLQRLREGCLRLKIPLDFSLLSQDIDKLIEQLGAQKIEQAVVKIALTRGSGKRGYSPLGAASPTRIICADNWNRQQEAETSQGVRIRFCDTVISRSYSLAGIKHLNRLENVLARSEWSDPAIFEGLLCDDREQIIEGTMSNVFIVDKQNKLLTPCLHDSGVKGVLRQHIIECLAEKVGVDCREANISPQQLFDAREVFLTNSLIGIVPVTHCNSNSWLKGPVTEALERCWGCGKNA